MRPFFRLPSVLLLLVLLLFLCAWISLSPPQPQKAIPDTSQPNSLSAAQQNVMGAQPLPPLADGDLRYIMHAGGLTPDGQKETNSLEALNLSYSQGYRVLEIDFVWTADDELVCIHDWDGYYTSKTTGVPRPPLSQFEGLRATTYSYTSLTLDALAQWMEEHPESYIVTDVKENPVLAAQIIAQRHPHLVDRLIIQIYGEAEYAPVLEAGYPRIIYTLYALPYADKMDTQRVVAFVRSCPNLIGLTFSCEIATPAYLSALKEGGVPLFIHTIDDPEMQDYYFQLGAAGLYTNIGAGIA